ncbi:MAG: radical SAM protein [Candidatus Bathyarchaeota archaeon]|nr:MAG: radical SAM protein [Candidatus Bathyarchaeota archaeon]
MVMKVSFINPSPNEEPVAMKRIHAIASFPPLGILYLATVLIGRGEEVSVLDQPAKGLTVEETVEWVEREDPDVLGLSPFGTSGFTSARLSREVKKRRPNTTIVYGNYYATFNAERILRKYPSVDIVVRGEGEETIVDLVDSIDRGGELGDVQGITFRKESDIVSTPDRPLIRDLDSIPIPDRSLLDGDYHNTIAGAKIAVRKFTSIISSRGCVHRCKFCSCTKFARGIWRPRSVENTMEELHYLAGEGYEQFIFVDDSFTLNQRRVIELCRRMREDRLDMEWICEGRVDNCSLEMFRELARAGCKIVFFGIESANQRILDYYNKRITPQQSVKAMRTARKAGIDLIHGSFILGAPDETREEIRNTLEFAKRLPIDIPQFNILGVYPGTEIWSELESKGVLNVDECWETPTAASKISPQAVPFEEIKRMGQEAVNEFLSRPGFIMDQVARTLRSRFRMGIVRHNLSRLDAIRYNIAHII